MGRPMVRSLSAFIAACNRAADQGFDTHVLQQQPVTFYKTKSGKLVHADSKCGHLSQSTPIRVKADPTEPFEQRVCSTCDGKYRWRIPDAAQAYLKAVKTVRNASKRLRRTLRGHQPNRPAFSVVGRDLLEADEAEQLRTEYPQLEVQLNELQQVRHQINDELLAVWRNDPQALRPYAADVREPPYPGDVAPMLGDNWMTRYSNAWEAYVEAVWNANAATTPGASTDTPHKAISKVLGRDSFDAPQQGTASRLLELFNGIVDEHLQEAAGEPDQTLHVSIGYRGTYTSKPVLRRLQQQFDGVTYGEENRSSFLRVPAAVAVWAVRSATVPGGVSAPAHRITDKGSLEFEQCGNAEDHTDDVLQIAASLVGDHTPAQAVEVALLSQQ